MTAPQPAERDKPLALDDPAALAWGAKLLQAALERRRRRLAAKRKGGGRDAS